MDDEANEEVATAGNHVLGQRQFDRFRELVARHTGIALGPHKMPFVCGRLSRRLRQLGISDFDEYYDLVTSPGEDDELRRFINAVTTNKTSFFREAHHFDDLRAHLAGSPRKVRVWCAASSTGEEPWSLAITLAEILGLDSGCDLRLLASDIDTDVLATAERGVYGEDRLEGLDDAQLRRWFVEGEGPMAGRVRVRKALRDLVTFRRINLTQQPWPIHARFDAIFCRNVLMYFDRETQEAVVSGMIRLLVPGGLLCLGHSESMLGMRPDLRGLGRTAYHRTDGAAHVGRAP